MTFNGAMGDVQTLAHELGHTFHSYLMRKMRPWAADYPMTLAETASTFAENLVTNAALKNPETSDAARVSILDQRLQDSSAFLLNIPMRFDFESSFYEQRKSGELSVRALQELMLDAQRKNYGESIDPAQLDPWFWASKLHFYITEISFYNFPYTFGYLFSMGIFARFLAEGPEFLTRYESLLMQTGSAPAEKVALDALGVDLQKPEFWNASIDLIAQDWKSFDALTS
jgi:oligoendopeptidase F